MRLKVSSAKWRPFCLGLNVLMCLGFPIVRANEDHVNDNSCMACIFIIDYSLLWRHNGCYGVSNHQPHDCLLNRSFRRRSKKTSKLRVTGLCAWNSPVTGEFPAQMASNTENVSIWWCHHGNKFGDTTFHSLWSSDVIWSHRSGSTLFQVRDCCLVAPSHCRNQCWLIIKGVRMWHSHENNFIWNAHELHPQHVFREHF